LRGGGKGGCQRCADDRAEDFAAGKMRIVHGRNLSISRGAMLARVVPERCVEGISGVRYLYPVIHCRMCCFKGSVSPLR
jgi:pyrroloquinoline quinone (PQQ) biosynthesis protein C